MGCTSIPAIRSGESVRTSFGWWKEYLRGRGMQAIRADASWNSEGFYIRQGYEPLGPRPADNARPMRKVLLDERAG